MNKLITVQLRIILVAAGGVTLFFIQDPIGFLLFSVALLVLLSAFGAFVAGSRRFLVVLTMLALELAMTEFGEGSIWIILSTVFYVLSRFSLVAMLGALVTKTMSVSELIRGLRGLRLPESIVLPVSVMLRFFPTIREEYGSVRDCMKIRGIDTDFWSMIAHPIRSMEYVFVPLLMRSCKIADELTMSATVRGIDRKLLKEKR